MPYVIQHQTQQLWEVAPRWNLISRQPTIDAACTACTRILRAWPGQAPKPASDYRIVETTKNGRPVATYNVDGELTAILIKKKAKVVIA